MLAALSALSVPQDLAFHMAIALLVSAVGFLRVVYFVSLGYAGSVAAMALLLLLRMGSPSREALTLHCALLLLYGLRLGSYLALRERQPAYRREIPEIAERSAGISLTKRIGIWLGVSLLYVLMFSPALFQAWVAAASGPSTPAPTGLGRLPTWLGLLVMVTGLGLESLADAQKSAAKKLQPTRFCDQGLYRFVRCPNYLGEILFWIGNFLAGLSAYHALWQWAAATTGLVCIVLIMLGSTKRLEAKQAERYGKDPEYQRYITTVPVLFPWVPVYSLQGVRVYLE